MTHGRANRRALALALVLLAAPAGVAIAAGLDAGSDPAAQSGDLAGGAPLAFSAPQTGWDGARLVDRAAALAHAVPLPAGGNFNGIRWDELPDAGDQDIQFLLQVNAACQWLRAIAAGRGGDAAPQVAREIPGWPALRGRELGDAFRSAFAQAGAGGQGPSPQLQQCEQAQERQIAYATVQGAAPPA